MKESSQAHALPGELRWRPVRADSATCTRATAAPCISQRGRETRSGFAEILRLIICRPLPVAMGEGVRCWQGSCELFGGDHRELNFQPGLGRGARGTPYAKDSTQA